MLSKTRRDKIRNKRILGKERVMEISQKVTDVLHIFHSYKSYNESRVYFLGS